MKKILLTICLVPFMLVAVELHPQEECEELRYSMSTNVSAIDSIVNNGLHVAAQDLAVLNSLVNISISDFKRSGDAIQYEGGESEKQAYYNCANNFALNYASTLSSNSFYTAMGYYDSSTNSIASLRSVINSIDCTQCSVSNTNCCDFSEIIDEIDRLAGEVHNVYDKTININTLMTEYYSRFSLTLNLINSAIRSGFLGATNLLWQIDTKLDSLTNTVYSGFDSLTNLLTQSNNLLASNNSALVSGFGNTTNLLSAIYGVDSVGWGVSTNFLNMMYIPGGYDEWVWNYPELYTSLSYPGYSQGVFDRFYKPTYFNNEFWQWTVPFYGLAPAYYFALEEIIGAHYAQNAWMQYQHDFMYPPITNALASIYVHQTNYFSFFRGELGVNGVLADWTPQDGGYYDFLTNHYLSIMRGDTLPPSLATKTNWFSRIETLLAALVFPDSQTTNVVDSSAFSNEQQALQGAISSVNTSASTSFSSFNSSANSIVTLFQNYSQAFDDVSLPGRFVFFTLSNFDGDSDVVSFSMSENPALNLFVEGCRAVTTFSWASVGIFCLLRFMIWACRGIFYACVFLYKAISSVLR